MIVPEINAHGVFKVKVNPSEETSEMYSGKSFAISWLLITPVAPRGKTWYSSKRYDNVESWTNGCNRPERASTLER